VSDDGNDGRDGCDANREDRLTDQRVDERRLASLELADRGDIEAALEDPSGRHVGVDTNTLRIQCSGDFRHATKRFHRAHGTSAYVSDWPG